MKKRPIPINPNGKGIRKSQISDNFTPKKQPSKTFDIPKNPPNEYNVEDFLSYQGSNQAILDDVNDDEKSTQIELKRVYEDHNDLLQKSNCDSNIIIKEMKQLLDNGIETQSAAFLNNQLESDIAKLQESIKKTETNYKFLIDQRNALISIDFNRCKPTDISNATFALQMENELIQETCSKVTIDYQECESRIQDLQKTLKDDGSDPNSKDDANLEKIADQYRNNLQSLNVINAEKEKVTNQIIQDKTNEIEDIRVDSALSKARGTNSMIRRYAHMVQSNFADVYSKYEDLNEQCSLIWPKLNGYGPADSLMEGFLNEMKEQANLTEQIQVLRFNLDNILRSAGVSVQDDSLQGLLDTLKNASDM